MKAPEIAAEILAGIYKSKVQGNTPSWVILDVASLHELKTLALYGPRGDIANQTDAISTIYGLKIAIADSYMGTTLEIL